MFENEHIHFVQDRDGRFYCIDVSRVEGRVFSVSYYTNGAVQPAEIEAISLSPSLV
jgi:hypothetical protein